MRFADVLRLGFAGVKAHKKRGLVVVIIVGLLFGVITAGAFALQGLENAVLGEMLAPTDGKVLVISSVETQICGENCEVSAEVAKMKRNVERYGGELISVGMSQTADGMFYELAESIFVNVADDVDSGVTQVVVPLTTAAQLAGLELPERDAEIAKRVAAIKAVREQTLHQVVESKTGERYYIAEILPGGVYASDLAFWNIEQGGHPLDLIFNQMSTGVSQDFLVESLAGDVEEVDVEALGVVFAQFEDVKAAYNYYQDKANYCSETDRIFGTCGKEYKYQVIAAVADPLTTYENLQNVWLVFKIVAAVLAVIALIIAISTYGRLIGKDMKIIALYHAMGATGGQIRVVYIVYLLMLSALAVGFAIIVGWGLAMAVSLVNEVVLQQLFALGLGVVDESIWLVGWSNLAWYLTGAMVIVVVLTVLISNGNFRARELAQKLK